MPAHRNAEIRFWEKVCKDGPVQAHMDTACWLWTGSRNKNGYGQFNADYHKKPGYWLSHRFSYHLMVAHIPATAHVLHRCDVRNCVRPEHLFLGTHTDNMQDMMRKQRKRTRFSQHVADEIRKDYAAGGITQWELARRHGVGQGHISDILRGRSWTVVPDDVPSTAPTVVLPVQA